MSIRLATAEDVPAIARFMDDWVERSPASYVTTSGGEDAWRRRFDDEHALYPWLVAEEGGRIAGFARARPYRSREADGYAVETFVFVDESRRNQGLGRTLYEALFRVLHLQGYFTAVAVVTVPDPVAEHLHEGLGMREVGLLHRAGYKHGRWHDAKLFALALQDDQEMPDRILPAADVE